MAAHNHGIDPSCPETLQPDGTVRGACMVPAPAPVERERGVSLSDCVRYVFVSDKATPEVLAKLNHSGLSSTELRIRQS